MNWLFELHRTNPTAQAIAIISLVCVAGMSLGSVSLRGIKLGTSGVLFAGLLFGHFSQPINHETLEFVKEFGLILFVFCIGLQLGPGFFASLRNAGLRLNTLALAVILLGSVTAVFMGWLLQLDNAAVLGVLSGGTTNMPSLGAAQQTLVLFEHLTTSERTALPALACAVAYPMGVIGAIGSLLTLKTIFRVDVKREVEAYIAAGRREVMPLERRTLVVTNPNLSGLTISQIPSMIESGVVVSRIQHDGESEPATATRSTILQASDRLLVIGTQSGIQQFQRVVGTFSQENLVSSSGAVTQQRVVVTNSEVLGKTIEDLALDLVFGVIVTRVTRGDLQLTAVPALRLQFGDVLNIVGPAESIGLAAGRLGNSVRALNETQFVPLFAGIALGIVLGMFPVNVPGLPQPLRLGLAGGPLIVAILVGRIGRIGPLVWHMPQNANMAFREFGIALFFACVGLMSGPSFFAVAASQTGLYWILAGSCVSVLPLLSVGAFARIVLGANYVELAGVLAGSTTDPPALAFLTNTCQSEAPAVAYVTVYPLSMLLRIMIAQVLALVLCG